MSDPSAVPPSPAQPKLLDRESAAIRAKHYSRRTEEAYVRGKNIDFACGKIPVCEGKGAKDSVTMLPEMCIPALRKHIEEVKGQHYKDLSEGLGTVHMPYAPAGKYPNAKRERGRQYVFPASRLSTRPRTGLEKRHDFDKSAMQKAVRQPIRSAGLHKHAGRHGLRHSFAAHLPEAGYHIRTVEELLGHEDREYHQMIYTHAQNKGGMVVQSPADRL